MFGIQRFLTQKLSWSLVNKFPHHTFLWQGIDGSEVLTHFPPADSYHSYIKAEELLKITQNLKDKGRVNHSIMLFGYGDGGGGPTEDMIMRQRRLKDVDGCPKVMFSSPNHFFDAIETSNLSNLGRWVGELYLELHNGTYTSQAATKKLNRKLEMRLQNVEFLQAVAAVWSKLEYTLSETHHRMWKMLLLNQFHDVLPGSSIGEVYQEAAQLYRDITNYVDKAENDAVTSLFGISYSSKLSESDLVALNTLSWERTELIKLYGKPLVVTVPSMSFSRIVDGQSFVPVHMEIIESSYVMQNEFLRVVIDSLGRIKSMILLASGQEVIPCGQFGNQLVLFDDIPLYWDAWDVMDYHLESRKPIMEASEISHTLDEGGSKCTVHLCLGINSKSRIELDISLLACKPYLLVEASVDWNESHKFLKVEFPVNVLAEMAKHEVQFGHISRPTHRNTSWDWAKFEVCSHKWIDLSEQNWGVALLNDCKYGHSVHRNVMSLSLLRAPKAPDQHCDIGRDHHFVYALMPHTGTLQEAGVIQKAYEINNPIRLFSAQTALQQDFNGQSFGSFLERSLSFFAVSAPNVVLETLKVAENGGRTIIARIYEAFGSRCTAKLTSSLGFKQYCLCSGLEEPLEMPHPWPTEGISLKFTPFQIKSIMLQY